MNNLQRKEIAFRTIEIIEKGFYKVNGKTINVKDDIINSYNQTICIKPNETIYNNSKNKFKTEIVILNSTTIEAIQTYKNCENVLVLNFASAKNPGGGFLGGAMSQEKSLARSSSLFNSLNKCKEMYEYNRSKDSYLYSDYMIYSPEVVFWMDDEGQLLSNPIKVDVITSPAPNKGAMIQNNQPIQITDIEETFLRRIRKILKIALKFKRETLILGAWGCGVFRNEPNEIANYFHQIIENEFKNEFKKIIFAVLDNSMNKKNIKPFEIIFNHKKNENNYIIQTGRGSRNDINYRK